MTKSLPAPPRFLAVAACLVTVLAFGLARPASAQYFGKNKVQFDRFQFQVLETPHFEIYYYPEEESSARLAGRMAERWYARLSLLLTHELRGKQPLILYASHPHFAQTNVVDSMIGEGTGGVTEGQMRRITLPLGATLAETDHVIGHELVHAFQYDILGPAVQTVPLWFIEGMAEYLSIGPRDPQTAMWLRDAAIEDRLPDVKDLNKPDYFPYRWGQALWAYIGGRYGDDAVASALRGVAAPGEAGAGDAVETLELTTGLDEKALSSAWHGAIREMFGLANAKEAGVMSEGQVVIGGGEKRGLLNVGPALSPDGTKITFLSERDLFSIDLYLADATTGRVTKKLISTAVDPHFQSLQFLMSAGTWSPDGRELAVAAIQQGRPVLAIVDVNAGKVAREIKVPEVDEIFQPAWSPDGQRIVFTGQSGGFTDLYVLDLQASRSERLMNDAFADLQPAWSPDGKSIVFVTDRFTTNTETLKYGDYGLATITPGSPDIKSMAIDIKGNAIDPQWLPDGSAILFLSDASGRPEVYAWERASGRVSRVAVAATGIAGVTPLSPALSVAAKTPRFAYSVFRNRGFDVHVLDWSRVTLTPPVTGPDLATLPPARTSSTVAKLIDDPAIGQTSAASFTQAPYKSRLRLVDIGPQIGFATSSPFGTYVSGGIALTFSDVLGNKLLGTSFGINGGFQDIALQAIYADRSSRWNWGVFGDRVPYLSGGVVSGFTQQGGRTVYVQQVDRLRQTYQQLGAFTAYPLSPVTRLEMSVSGQRINYDREVQTIILDPVTGNTISDDTVSLPGQVPLTFFGTSAALIRDTSIFGPTGPLRGQRFHLDLMPTFGDLQLVNVTADYRQYFMPRSIRPFTIAGRVMHIGRYGSSSEDQRLSPLFLGYPDLVRGYGINSFDSSDCPPSVTATCPAYDRLFGSRVFVSNLELRAPLVGLFKGRLEYGSVPIDVFAFADAGLAWTRFDSPSFAGGERQWVTSVGGGARVNVFGIMVAELNMVRPLQRANHGWMFVFNLRPGF